MSRLGKSLVTDTELLTLERVMAEIDAVDTGELAELATVLLPSERLAAAGVVFCHFSEAVQSHPELIEKYLGSVVPYTDNFYASLNSAVFSDGSFVYVPKGVRCPMELSTYFRINAAKTGQF